MHDDRMADAARERAKAQGCTCEPAVSLLRCRTCGCVAHAAVDHQPGCGLSKRYQRVLMAAFN